MTSTEAAARFYTNKFGAEPQAIAYAPGRVEIMGNHTDYNGGYVLPAALDKATVLAGGLSGSDTCTLYAADFERTASFNVHRPQADPGNSWASYVMGVVKELGQLGIVLRGFNAVIHSDVPAGAGLSSSAALEVATALLLRELCPFEMEPMDVAKICQRAENEFVGVNCGILDQFSSVFGQQDSLLFLDCKTLDHDIVKMGRSDISIVICDSNVKHALTGGDYNTRRAECMAAANHFGKDLLRDVSIETFESRKQELPNNQKKRAEHVLYENARVLSMCDAIKGTDTGAIGVLLAQGHASCRDLFENSTPEIDALVEIAVSIPGCYGAKLTGGGWGGSTVNLVETAAADAFMLQLNEGYRRRVGKTASIYLSRAGIGAHSYKL